MSNWDYGREANGEEQPKRGRPRKDAFQLTDEDRKIAAKAKRVEEGNSPNPTIDAAIKAMMDKIKGKGDDSVPPDVAVKIINTAIAWEKAKHHITDAENPFNPDDL